jgi:hypothetical protein
MKKKTDKEKAKQIVLDAHAKLIKTLIPKEYRKESMKATNHQKAYAVVDCIKALFPAKIDFLNQ